MALQKANNIPGQGGATGWGIHYVQLWDQQLSKVSSNQSILCALWYCITCKSLDFIHLFIPDISIVPLQVHYYSEALPTTALILCM